MIQKCCWLLWAWAHLKWSVAKWKTVLWSDKWKLTNSFRKSWMPRPPGYRGEGPSSLLSVQKPASVIVWGRISAHGLGSLHNWEGTIYAEQYTQILEQHMLPSTQRCFQGRPCILQQDNAKLHSACITTAWLCSRRDWTLNWPACSPDLAPTENIWCIMKWKILQRRTQTVEHYIKNAAILQQEWDNISLTNSSNWSPQFPKVYNIEWVLLKEDVMQHSGKDAPVPTFWKRVAGIKF